LFALAVSRCVQQLIYVNVESMGPCRRPWKSHLSGKAQTGSIYFSADTANINHLYWSGFAYVFSWLGQTSQFL